METQRLVTASILGTLQFPKHCFSIKVSLGNPEKNGNLEKKRTNAIKYAMVESERVSTTTNTLQREWNTISMEWKLDDDGYKECCNFCVRYTPKARRRSSFKKSLELHPTLLRLVFFFFFCNPSKSSRVLIFGSARSVVLVCPYSVKTCVFSSFTRSSDSRCI